MSEMVSRCPRPARCLPTVRMDSEVQRDGRILDLIDDAWREDKLPYEDVAIPLVGERRLVSPRFHTAPAKNSTGNVAGGTADVYERFLGWV